MIRRRASGIVYGAFGVALVLFAAPAAQAQDPVPEPTADDTLAIPPDPFLSNLGIDTGGGRAYVLEPRGLVGFSVDRYTRTEGLIPSWGLNLTATDPDKRPSFSGRIGVATTHEQTYWYLSVRQRLPFPGAVNAIAEHFQQPATNDDWKIGQRENDAATLFAGSDLLDWWRERGYRLTVDAETPGGRLGGYVTWADMEQRSLVNRSPFSVLHGDFIDNPPIQEGNLHAVKIGIRYHTADAQSPLLPTPGWLIDASWERGGGLLGGDIDFIHAIVDVKRYTRLGRDAWWDWRATWRGAATSGDVPRQRKTTLGGAGSLRGFERRSFSGSEGAQASTELRLPLPVNDLISLFFLSWHWVMFADAGAVSEYDAVHADVGTGISGINLFSYLGFFVAQRVTDNGADDSGPQFIVRLRRDF